MKNSNQIFGLLRRFAHFRVKWPHILGLSFSALVAVAGLFYTDFPKGPSPHRGFYFWKITWDPTPTELRSLEYLNVNRLFMRFFDVAWDAERKAAVPVSPIRFQKQVPPNLEIVPVVYIKNQVFEAASKADVALLADQVWNKVDSLAKSGRVKFTEWQVDCDWTDRSRPQFFHFLNLVRTKTHLQKKVLSATLRLHQIKYSRRTGIPPVDRGMLMFYNMGKLQADAGKVSIYNNEDASLYAAWIKKYPMQMDLVLPIFSWIVHSRNGRIVGLLDKVEPRELATHTGFDRLDNRTYAAKSSFFLRGLYFREGDRLMLEQVTPQVTREAAQLALTSSKKSNPFKTVALFDLDERNIGNYEKSDLQKIFWQFN